MFRVGLAYIVGAWLILQVTEVLVELLELPLAAGKFIVLVLALGFIPALVLSWVYELTADGLKRDSGIASVQPTAGGTARKLNILIVVMLALVAAYFVWESRFKGSSAPGETTTIAETAPPSVKDAGASNTSAPGAAGQNLSIAVLPFVNMSGNVENEYFADGLSEEILNRLAQVPQLRVIGRTSSFAFKGDNRDLREIGQLLDVANVLEGSVRRQGDSVRVTAQLIATSDGTHLWSQTYDRELQDIFQVQDDISQRVVDALDIVLDEEQRQRMLNAGVRNVEAFVAFQEGQALLIDAHAVSHEAMLEMLAKANERFAVAAALAPPFAAALASMSDLYAHQLVDPGMSLETRLQGQQRAQEVLNEAYEAARDPARKAMINLDRTFYMDDWSLMPSRMAAVFDGPVTSTANWIELLVPFADIEILTRHFEQQLSHEPAFTLTHLILAELYHRQGQPEKAREVIELAQGIDPDHRWVIVAGFFDALIRGDMAEASAMVEAQPEIGSRIGIMLLALEGQLAEARAEFDKWLIGRPGDSREHIAPMAWLGDRESANQAAAALDKLPGGSMELIRVINNCRCGAPFDLESTPNLAARLEEAQFGWPPTVDLGFPAKDW